MVGQEKSTFSTNVLSTPPAKKYRFLALSLWLANLSVSCGSQPTSFVEQEARSSKANTSSTAEDAAGQKRGSLDGGGESAEQIAGVEGAAAGGGSGSGKSTAKGELPSGFTKSFEASLTGEVSMQLSFNGAYVDQEQVMRATVAEESLSYEQIVRQDHTELFPQGSVKASASDRFTQVDTGILDIVVVIDNSGSMSDEQDRLKTQLPELLKAPKVSKSDWRIKVVTTDPSNGCLGTIINHSDLDREAAFARAIAAGISGSGNERGIFQAHAALNCPGQNWLRSNSTIAVLIVSDEDNCSNGTGCGSVPHRDASFLVNYLQQIRPPRLVGGETLHDGKIFGIVKADASCQQAPFIGNIYMDAIRATGSPIFGASDESGVTGTGICASSYKSFMGKISANIDSVLKNQFVLSYSPLSGAAVVKVNNHVLSSGYSISGNVITFTEKPAEGAIIEVGYSYHAVPPSKQFTLTKNAESDTLRLSIDGKEIAKTDYSYDEASKSIVFGETPEGREIKAIYKSSDELKSEYSVPGTVVADSLKVWVNDQVVVTENYKFDQALNRIKFINAPADGAKIRIDYVSIQKPQLDYPFFAPQGFTGQLAVLTKSGQNMAFELLEGAKIRLAGENFVYGEKFIVRLQNEPSSGQSIKFEQIILPGSLSVKGAEVGDCAAERIVIFAGNLNFDACGFSSKEKITVSFKVVHQHRLSFDLEDQRLLASLFPFKVLVFVNDQPAANGSVNREGSLLNFSELPYGAKIRAEVVWLEK